MTWPEFAHTECPEILRLALKREGIDATITDQQPAERGPIQPDGYRCPHNQVYWAMPTEEQLLKWAVDGA